MHLTVPEQYGIVPWFHLLIGMGKGCAIAFLRVLACTWFPLHLARIGHEQHIQQVAASRPAQMGVAETNDRSISVVVAGAPVPTFGICIGAELHGTKRN